MYIVRRFIKSLILKLTFPPPPSFFRLSFLPSVYYRHGIIIKDFNFVGGLTPAISLGGTQQSGGGKIIAEHFEFQFNFGERPFNIQQTPVGYRPVHQWLLAERARIRVLKSGGKTIDTLSKDEKLFNGSSYLKEEENSKWAIDRMVKSGNIDLIADMLSIPPGDAKDRAMGVAKILGLANK